MSAVEATQDRYLFGDTNLAARRLKILSEVFAECSRDFLLQIADRCPRSVVDLGCGPGYSTHFLARILSCVRVVGLDNSQNFISLARETGNERVSFCRHDITSLPFPAGPSDLLYCRFTMAHLLNPRCLLESWATQLRSEGLLLIEETEQIQTDHPVFTTYLSIVETLFDHQSKQLCLGPVLDGIEDPEIIKRRVNKVREVEVSLQRAATLFFLNLQFWKNHPFIRTSVASSLINELEDALCGLSKRLGGEVIRWQIRQIAFERTEKEM
jgi:SAM-dependent methyltransferase